MEGRSLFRRILFYLSSPKCLRCKEPLSVAELSFCPKCNTEFLNNLTRNCSYCSNLLSECDCAPDFLKAHFVTKLYKLFRYTGKTEDQTGAALIYTLKNRARHDAVKFTSDIIVNSLNKREEDFSEFVFTNIPRRRKAILEYGVDQSEIIAKTVAKRLGASYLRILKSKSKKEQKHLSRDERLKNADFDSIKGIDLKGKRVIIVDDIVTTGASMGCASVLIKSAGAKEIRGLALAIAYPD